MTNINILMLESKTPVTNWGIVETDENTYYIMYCL